MCCVAPWLRSDPKASFTLLPICWIRSLSACCARSCGPEAMNRSLPLGSVCMSILALDRLLMSLIISGSGRLSWPRGRMFCWSMVMDSGSAFRPGNVILGGPPRAFVVGVAAPEGGVEAREFPLRPFVFPLVTPAGFFALQMDDELAAALALPAPSSGNTSCDCVSKGFVSLTAFCFPAAFSDRPDSSDAATSALDSDGPGASSSTTSSTVACSFACCWSSCSAADGSEPFVISPSMLYQLRAYQLDG